MEFRRVLFRSFIQNIGNETEKITSDPKAQADRTVLTLLIQQYNRVQIILQKVEDTLPMSDYLKIDRKSTRLNSSHQIISYAVFCLKKKNNTNLKQLIIT